MGTPDHDDGFEEILPDADKAPKAACVIGLLTLGKAKARKVSIVFRLNLLPPEVAKILREGPRFSIAFNPHMRVVRIKAEPRGRYELANCPTGRGADQPEGNAVMVRFPFPPSGMHFTDGRFPAEPDSNLQQRAVLIDLPEAFWPKSNASPLAPQNQRAVMVRGNVTPSLMGDPAPGRSALARKVGT